MNKSEQILEIREAIGDLEMLMANIHDLTAREVHAELSTTIDALDRLTVHVEQDF